MRVNQCPRLPKCGLQIRCRFLLLVLVKGLVDAWPLERALSLLFLIAFFYPVYVVVDFSFKLKCFVFLAAGCTGEGLVVLKMKY